MKILKRILGLALAAAMIACSVLVLASLGGMDVRGWFANERGGGFSMNAMGRPVSKILIRCGPLRPHRVRGGYISTLYS